MSVIDDGLGRSTGTPRHFGVGLRVMCIRVPEICTAHGRMANNYWFIGMNVYLSNAGRTPCELLSNEDATCR